jgi:hypothetical protein
MLVKREATENLVYPGFKESHLEQRKPRPAGHGSDGAGAIGAGEGNQLHQLQHKAARTNQLRNPTLTGAYPSLARLAMQ